MSFLLQIELLAQVLLISLLSGLVGMDRERRDKSAGPLCAIMSETTSPSKFSIEL